MKNLYVIEGTSNSGKTTTSNFLKNYSQVLIVPEFSMFPEAPSPSKCLEDELLNQRIFLEIERKRMEYAKKMIEEGKIVFLERDFISILAVCYAFAKIGKYDAFKHAESLYLEMKDSMFFNEPDSYFFLTADHEEILNRNKTREKQLKKEWIKNDFDFYQKEFYDIISIGENKFVIDTTNSEPEYASKVIAKKLNLRR